MRINYILPCDAASRMDNGKTVLHGIFDIIKTVKEPTTEHPAVQPSMSFAFAVNELSRKYKKATLKIKHVETGLQIFSQDFDNPAPSNVHPAIAGIANVLMLKFPHLGKYQIDLYVDEELAGANSFDVSLLT